MKWINETLSTPPSIENLALPTWFVNHELWHVFTNENALYKKQCLMAAENNHVWQNNLHLLLQLIISVLNLLEPVKKAHMRNNTTVLFITSKVRLIILLYILVNITLRARISTLHKTEHSWLLLWLRSLTRSFTCTFRVCALPSTNCFEFELWPIEMRFHIIKPTTEAN